MAIAETELQMVERHVRDGERIVRRQREIIEELSCRGHPTVLATQLLAEFELSLDDHRAHLAKLIQPLKDMEKLRSGTAVDTGKTH